MGREQFNEYGSALGYLNALTGRIGGKKLQGVAEIGAGRIKEVPDCGDLNMVIQGLESDQSKVLLNAIWSAVEIYFDTGKMPVVQPADDSGDDGDPILEEITV